MIILPFTARLMLDGIGFSLFMICFAYYWQGNTFHEWAGALFIAFVIAHNIQNQMWYRRKAKLLPSKPFGYIRLVAQTCFISVACVLLVSSILISRSINTYGPIDYDYWIRQAHHLTAYWLLVMVGVHLGRNWPKIIGLLKSKRPEWLRIVRITPIKVGLIFGSLLLAGYGFIQLGVVDKLLMNPSLNMWDFTHHAPEFLLFIGGIVFGFVTLSYQLTKHVR